MRDMNELCDEILPILEEQTRQNNTLTYREFSQFLPLFQKDGVSKVGDTEYLRLCDEWKTRISLFHKVTIIDPSAEEGNRVMVELPPVFVQLSEINKAGENAARIADYFADALTRDTRFNGEAVKALEYMLVALSAAQAKDIDSKRDDILENVRLRKNIDTGISSDEEIVAPEAESTDEFVWE